MKEIWGEAHRPEGKKEKKNVHVSPFATVYAIGGIE
jgi:hypothetical protein